jgi:hypothetical protein
VSKVFNKPFGSFVSSKSLSHNPFKSSPTVMINRNLILLKFLSVNQDTSLIDDISKLAESYLADIEQLYL